jgi:hypothetical protein
MKWLKMAALGVLPLVSSVACAQQALTPQAANAGTWAFEVGEDPFREDAVLDLRFLNEKVAGERGFIGLTPDKMGFARSDGQPARFWCANSTVYRQSEEEMSKHARYLAKQGIDMVRVHASISPQRTAPPWRTSTARTSTASGSSWRR